MGMRRWNSKSFSLIETIFEKLPFSFKVRTSVLSREAEVGASRSEGPLPADSVEKQRVACAESDDLNGARAPFLSGFAHLLRCRKALG